MTHCLPFLKGAAAKPAVVDAIVNVLAKTAPKITLSTVCIKSDPLAARQLFQDNSNVSFFGTSISSDEVASLGTFHSILTHTSNASIKDLNHEYKGTELCVVRAIVSDPEPCALRYRDRVDSLAGFNLGKELEHTRICMERAVQTAILEAKLHKSDVITLVLKSVTRHERMNALLQEVAQVACNNAGINLTTSHTTQLHNKLIMFPEQLRVVLANDVPASDLLEGIVLGISGGAGITHQEIVGNGIKGFVGNSDSPISSLTAACAAMKHLGYTEESENTLKVLKNTIAKESNRTKDLGGKLNPAEFANACLA